MLACIYISNTHFRAPDSALSGVHCSPATLLEPSEPLRRLASTPASTKEGSSTGPANSAALTLAAPAAAAATAVAASAAVVIAAVAAESRGQLLATYLRLLRVYSRCEC